jgi:broad specificity phosphatase PhoE
VIVTRIHVARHGETDWNREGRYQGRLDRSRLTQRGVLQARALAEALRASGARRVISSPLARCVQTAAPVAELLGVAVETDPLLAEIGHGTWEGRLRDEIARSDPQRMAAWRTAPAEVTFEGGESLRAVAARWNAFVLGLGSAQSAVIVTHDVLLRLAILAAGNRPLSQLWEPRVVNGGFALFRVDARGWHLEEECHAAHLGDLAVDPSAQAL